MTITIVFFSNRTNLDPWDQYSDSQIWEALENTHIKERVSDKKVQHCRSIPNSTLLEYKKAWTFILIPLYTTPLSSDQPAASFAPLRGDGERRELLGGRTAAALCGQSSAAQQQGADCMIQRVQMLHVEHCFTWMMIAAQVRDHFQLHDNRRQPPQIIKVLPCVSLHGITLTPSGTKQSSIS